MQNLSDNELDNRFREAAENYRPPFDADAWQAMQERLDHPTQTRKPRRFNRTLLFPLVFFLGLVTGVVLWKTISKSPDTGAPEKTQNASPNSNESATLTDSDQSAEKNPLDRATDVANDRSADNNSEVVTRSAVAAVVQKGANTRLTDGNDPAIAHSKPQAPSPASRASTEISLRADGNKVGDVLENNPGNTAIGRVSSGMIVSPSDDNGADTGRTDPVAKSPGATNNASREVVAGLPMVSTDSLAETPDKSPAAVESASSDREDKQAINQYPHRLSVVIAVSPDFSSVNFGRHTRPGSNYGLWFQYDVHKNISIQAGAIASKKIYAANDLEYQGHKVPKAEGDCRIIDIPLNIYYHGNRNARTSWFAGAGISSYLMTKENYVFYYDSYYGQTKYYRSVERENNEWFKVLNLSAGVSRRVNDRLFIEGEPFVKIPFSGIGDGKLNVHSLGLFLRLRYSILTSP